ncbi:SGNH/GDSL hydrolase family protein [Priestia koreensis]|uniref:SGNH/GDSL hydrolase family protein n=1 Tax=Priestia koreensis TaxID=284581 RepID=UPI0030189719
MKSKIMVYAGTVLITITCVAVIVVGYLNWHQRLESTAQASSLENEASLKQEEEKKLAAVGERTKNLPTAVKKKFNQAIQENRPLEIVLFGSEATSTFPNSWPDLLEKQLKAAYGDDFIHVTVKSYPEQTSDELISEGVADEVLALNPDLILVEAPIISDYQSLPMSKTLTNLAQLLTKWKEKQAAIIIQPPNPLYKNAAYVKAVSQLREWASRSHYTYVHHWEVWPPSTAEDLQSYLTADDHLLPNEKGQKLWSDFLTHYFISN